MCKDVDDSVHENQQLLLHHISLPCSLYIFHSSSIESTKNTMEQHNIKQTPIPAQITNINMNVLHVTTESFTSGVVIPITSGDISGPSSNKISSLSVDIDTFTAGFDVVIDRTADDGVGLIDGEADG